MINKCLQVISQKIEKNDNIAIFFHEAPDLDALGCAYAMKFFLQNKWPDKNIKIVGLDSLDQFFFNDLFFIDRTYAPNSFLTKSFGIIFDTSNSARVWSQRHNFCHELARIDHHPHTEVFADYEWIDSKYPAACQMVAEWLLDWDPKCVTPPICNYLYAGIVTDTNRMLYDSVLPSTYHIVGKLYELGCDRPKIHNIIYQKSINYALFSAKILNMAKFNIKLGFAWVKIPKNLFTKYKIVGRMSMVHVLSNLKGIKVWLAFYYDEELKKWRGSLRSKSLPINQIAIKYNGGGHILAAGFTINKKREFKSIIKDIKKYLDSDIQKNKYGYISERTKEHGKKK